MIQRLTTRRIALQVTAGAGLASCGMVQKSPFFSTLATFNRSSASPINRRNIDSLPYASMVAWFDGSARALLVLGEYRPENRLVWYSAEHQAITTWGPFVLTLIGTDVSLYSSTLNGQWSSDLRSMIGRKVGRTMDFQARSGHVSVATSSTFESLDKKMIDLIGERRSLLQIREHVDADKWHHYRNDYWIDEEDGHCWKSSLLVVPTMPKLNIIIGRMPKGQAG